MFDPGKLDSLWEALASSATRLWRSGGRRPSTKVSTGRRVGLRLVLALPPCCGSSSTDYLMRLRDRGLHNYHVVALLCNRAG